MGKDKELKVRNFHQAKWDEPVIFELDTEGERGILVPEVEPEIKESVGDGVSLLPKNMRRNKAPALPEIGQMRVLKHFLRLSQHCLGADLNVDLGQGTCTMKYSPKVNEEFVRSPKAAELHPLQDESTIQGALEIMYKLDLFLREISGMDRFSFQPGGGSHAILAMASIIAVHVWRMLPLAMVIILAGLASIPKDIQDAASVDGAGYFRQLFQITIPMMLPIMLVAVLFGIVFTATDIIIILVLTRGGPYDSTQVLVSQAFYTGIDAGDLAGGAAIALFLFPLLLAVAIFMLKIARRAEVT